jgi:hypothetical protein
VLCEHSMGSGSRKRASSYKVRRRPRCCTTGGRRCEGRAPEFGDQARWLPVAPGDARSAYFTEAPVTMNSGRPGSGATTPHDVHVRDSGPYDQDAYAPHEHESATS